MNDDELERRDLLKGIGALGAGFLSGCNALPGQGASDLRNHANQTQQRLKSGIPWNSYDLSYNVESLDLDVARLGPTGVENAAQYRVDIEFELSPNSNDLDGWLSTTARREEFFSLLNETTYDVLRETADSFSSYEPPQQPSHRNQVVEYGIKVNAEGCSYVSDTIPVARTDEILSSRSAYDDYVDSGRQYDISLEKGALGGLIC